MSRRPLSVTLVGCLFLGAGLVGLGYHGLDLLAWRWPRLDDLLVCLVRLVAVVGGVLLLRGRGWARWLLLAWLAYHVVLSVFHSVTAVIVHSLLLGGIGWLLLRRPAAEHFRRAAARLRAPPRLEAQPSHGEPPGQPR